MNKRISISLLALLFIALLMVGSCVELTGQRISWFYDEAKDELLILIHYDGIHDSGSDKNGIGVEQVPKFVESGFPLTFIEFPPGNQLLFTKGKG